MNKARMNELAFKAMMEMSLAKGEYILPVQTKSKVQKLAKKLGISLREAAELMKVFYTELFNETLFRIQQVVDDGKIHLLKDEKKFRKDGYHGGH